MNSKMKIGIALIFAGITCLVVGGLKFKSEKEVFKVPGFRATTTSESRIPGLGYVGAVLIAGGGALIALQFRRG